MKKVQAADKRDGWYEIEPLDAQRLIDEQPPNRPLRESKALRLSKPMLSNKWRRNGEPIILDEHDRLLDGQGRCRACVIAGKPFTSYVVHGVSRSTFTSIDTGQNRGGSDTLAVIGAKGNYVLASAISWLALACLKGSPASARQSGITNEEIASYYRKNAERVDNAVAELAAHFRTCPLPPSILCYVYMEACEIDEAKAKSWALGVAAGQNLSGGSPALLLRNRLLSIKGDAHQLTQFEKLALTIKSWNAYVAGKQLGVLKWTSRGAGGKQKTEQFPVIEYMKE